MGARLIGAGLFAVMVVLAGANPHNIQPTSAEPSPGTHKAQASAPNFEKREAERLFSKLVASAATAEAVCRGRMNDEALIQMGRGMGLNDNEMTRILNGRGLHEMKDLVFGYVISAEAKQQSICIELRQLHNGPNVNPPTVTWK
jgi:hypothetical protein